VFNPVRTAITLASLAATLAFTGCSTSGPTQLTSTFPAAKHKAIIFVWDGMRPDSIDAANTPNLSNLVKTGSYFSDNHSTYPTYTMANSASFATGSFIGTTGFNGNNTYAGPSTGLTPATGNASNGNPVDFTQPQFTEDWGILDDLNAYYQKNYTQSLLTVGTLFQAAQSAGLKTATAGKSGPAYLQDYTRGGLIFDENTAYPLSLAQEIQTAGFPLPANTPFMYTAGAITLAANNGSPTASGGRANLDDKATSDPTSTVGSRQASPNQYLANVFVQDILAKHNPDLSLFWLRNPDSTEHDYGPGTTNYSAALQAQDAVLGQIVAALQTAGTYSTTDIVVVSDHAHSSVSGPQNIFPLRAIVPSTTTPGLNTFGSPSTSGYSVSGYVRGADLLTRAGFHAYDGNGCGNEPVLNGITAAGTPIYPQLVDTTGSICGAAGVKYTTPSFKAPATLPADAVIVVTPGGSEMYFVPSHNPAIIQKLVAYLQAREEYGPIFVDNKYGSIPGTFNASAAKIQNASARNPDIIASMNFDETQSVSGKLGTTFNNAAGNRGMHGSFSPIDVHNTLVMEGPDFRAGFTDTLPSGNVDVAPTLAVLLGLSLPQADGRPLLEAFTSASVPTYTVVPGTLSTTTVTGVPFQALTDPNGTTLDTRLTGSYSATMHTKVLTDPNGKSYTYFDYVKVARQ
jgi:predicted AlkP superfamily pyrophosphatase or phosphodiesterase